MHKSRKMLIVIWAVAMITYIVVASKVEFVQLAYLLCGVPLAYIPSNVYQKTHLKKEDKNETTDRL